MYNTNIICTYNTPEVFLEEDNISENEKAFIRDVIYRQELLDILEIEEYDETLVNTAVNELYEKVKENTFLKECMIQVSKKFMNNDTKFGLMILYSYDYMYITHICVSEFLDKGKITDINMSNLRSIIF